MPVSEDEFERPVQTNPTPLSKAEQRKNNKPIMEKRRRARINHCLNELKTLILDAMKKDPTRHSKLEKADILEMTVKHLQQIQRQQLATAVATDPGVIMRFKSGFDECAAEVSRYISRLEGIDNAVKQRLTAHLHRCVSSLQQISTFPHQNMFASLANNCDKASIVVPSMPSIPGDVNNNSNQNSERIQIPGGLHLIPSRLPTGELALLVPNSSHISTFLNGPTGASAFQFPNASMNLNTVLSPTLGRAMGSDVNHASAFTAVSKNQDYPSPTSTADIIKKEPNLSDKEDSYLNRPTDLNYYQNYNFKVTEGGERADLLVEDQNRKSLKMVSENYDNSNATQNFEKCNSFENKSVENDDQERKVNQRASTTSFQKNVADSTTSFTQMKEDEFHETGFKPFQVDIPNSHLKAQISISRNPNDQKSSNLRSLNKLNSNLPPNSNKSYQKSFQIPSSRVVGCEPFKMEPLSVSLKSEEHCDLVAYQGCSLPLSSSPIGNQIFNSSESHCQKKEKRPLSNESSEMSSSTSTATTSCEPCPKIPRISLNVTLSEDHHQPKSEQTPGNLCKRISVIVEDSSKSSVSRENKRQVAVNVSSSKDMWRPW